MSLIQFSNFSFSYGDTAILNQANFQINPGEKVGIVGNNGTGKTTLLKLITGELSSNSGNLTIGKEAAVGYMSQHLDFQCNRTLFDEMDTAFEAIHQLRKNMRELEWKMSQITGEELEKLTVRYGNLQEEFEKKGGYQLDYQISKILLGVGFTKEDYSREINYFSGGEKSRVALAKLLLSCPNILLLDEPTNHLDIHGVAWLEEYLREYQHTVIIVSHDRYFLDKTVQRILELESQKIKSYKGNYTSYIRQKTELIAVQEKVYSLQQASIEKKQEFIRKNIAGQKTKQAQSRRIELEKMEKIAPPPKRVRYHLSFPSSKRGGNDVLSISHVSKKFLRKSLINDLSFQVKKGEKIGVIGPNGSGKSTLLKMIVGQLEPDSGMVQLGSDIEIGYFSQNLENQNPENSVLEEVWQADPTKTMGEMRTILASFLFYAEDVFAKVKTLSGGERSRVEIAKMILSGINFLVLDEPTNHFDIFAKMALEEALKEYSGTIITVSHDRYFLDQLATRILYLENGKHQLFDGNYSDFQRSRKTNEENSKRPGEAERKQEYLKQKKENRQKDRTEKKRAASIIEKEIEETEKKLAAFDTLLQKPEIFSDFKKVSQIDQEYKELTAQLEKLYPEWEEAQK